MLGAILDLVSDLGVVRVAFLHVEVDEQSEVIVEAENFVLGISVVSKLTLEEVDIACTLDVPGSTVEAVPVLWHEFLNVDAVLRVQDVLIVIGSSTICALVL